MKNDHYKIKLRVSWILRRLNKVLIKPAKCLMFHLRHNYMLLILSQSFVTNIECNYKFRFSVPGKQNVVFLIWEYFFLFIEAGRWNGLKNTSWTPEPATSDWSETWPENERTKVFKSWKNISKKSSQNLLKKFLRNTKR